MSKPDYKRLQELSKIGRKASKELESLVDGFSESLDIVIRNAPEQDKGEIEKVKALFNKSFNLAKQGNTVEATEIIKNYQNGRKNSKKGV